MPTITTVDATWTTGVSMDDAELRRADSTMFLGDGSVNGVRGGIVRHGDTSLAVTVNGSDQVTVQAGAFVIPAATGLGVYRGALSAATAATGVSARNATNPRIDLIVIQAPGIVKTIDGTPGASPTAPALPAQHIELGRVTVPAVGGGAVTVDSSWRAYATGLGGTLLVETSARLPGSGLQKGQAAVALDTGVEHIWNGTAWVSTGWVTWTPTVTNAGVAIAHAVIYAKYAQVSKTVHWAMQVNLNAAGAGPLRFTLPVTAVDRNNMLGVGREQATTGVLYSAFTASPTTANVFKYDNTTAIANGNEFVFSGTYEAA